MEDNKQELSFGERAVGIEFNPSNYSEVYEIKSLYAQIINKMNDLRNSSSDHEQKRHASIAITEAETAQMRAVKALTWS